MPHKQSVKLPLQKTILLRYKGRKLSLVPEDSCAEPIFIASRADRSRVVRKPEL
jgi:hypothetical protein